MWDLIYGFFEKLHGNPAAPSYDDFMLAASYFYLGLIVIGIVWFIIFLFRVFYNLISTIPHAFLRPARIRTRWIELWENRKGRKRRKSEPPSDIS